MSIFGKDPASENQRDFDDDFEDSGLDDWGDDLEFGDEGEDIDSDDDRNPSKKHKNTIKDLQAFTGGMKSGVIAGLATKVDAGFPDVKAAASSAIDTFAEMKSMKEDFQTKLRPTLNQSRNLLRQLLPHAKSVMSDRVYKSVEAKLGPVEESYKAPSQGSVRSKEQSGTLEAIFQAESTERMEDRKRALITDAVKSRTDAVRHHSLLEVLNNISNQTSFRTSFLRSTETAYMKKTLELRYRHLYVAEDTLSVLKFFAESAHKDLDRIRHNTALPDYQKITAGEMIRQASMNKFLGGIQGTLSNYMGGIKDKIMENYVNPAFDGLNSANDAAEMLASMMDPESGMGPKPNMKRSMLGLVGGGVGGILGKMGGRELINKIPEETRKTISQYARLGPTGLKLILEQLRRGDIDFEYKEELSSFLETILPEMDRTGGRFENSAFLDPTAASTITRRFTTTVEDIIPGLLTQQLKVMKQILTGDTAGTMTEDVAYDYETGTFMSTSKLRGKIETSIYGDERRRGAILKGSADAVRAGIATRGDELNASFEESAKDISMVMLNIAYGKTSFLLNIADIQAVAQGGELETEWQKTAFNGIKAPAAVATVLLSIVTNEDGSINTVAKSAIEVHIGEMIASVSDSARANILKNFQLGYRGLMQEDIVGKNGIYEVQKQPQLDQYAKVDSQMVSKTYSFEGLDTFGNMILNEKTGFELLVNAGSDFWSDVKLRYLPQFMAKADDAAKAVAKKLKLEKEYTATVASFKRNKEAFFKTLAEKKDSIKNFTKSKMLALSEIVYAQMDGIEHLRPLVNLFFTPEGTLRDTIPDSELSEALANIPGLHSTVQAIHRADNTFYAVLDQMLPVSLIFLAEMSEEELKYATERGLGISKAMNAGFANVKASATAGISNIKKTLGIKETVAADKAPTRPAPEGSERIHQLIEENDLERAKTTVFSQMDADRFRHEFTTDQIQKDLPDELFKEDDGWDAVEDKSKWDTDYWTTTRVKLMNNFSKEKLNHSLEVMKYLREQSNPDFQVTDQEKTKWLDIYRNELTYMSSDKSECALLVKQYTGTKKAIVKQRYDLLKSTSAKALSDLETLDLEYVKKVVSELAKEQDALVSFLKGDTELSDSPDGTLAYASGGTIDPISGERVGTVNKATLVAGGRAEVGEKGIETIVPHNHSKTAKDAYAAAKKFHEGTNQFASGGTIDTSTLTNLTESGNPILSKFTESILGSSKDISIDQLLVLKKIFAQTVKLAGGDPSEAIKTLEGEMLSNKPGGSLREFKDRYDAFKAGTKMVFDDMKSMGSRAFESVTGFKPGQILSSTVASASQFAKTIFKRYVDIYDGKNLDIPLVRAVDLKKNLLSFQDGNEIKDSYSIDRQVVWRDIPENGENAGNIAITREQIEEGLTNYKGEPLVSTGSKLSSLLMAGKDAAGNLFSSFVPSQTIRSIISLAGDLLRKGMEKKNPFIDVYWKEEGRRSAQPLLYGVEIKRSKYISASGKVVKTAYGIKEVIYDVDTKNILVNEDHLKAGLVDIDGNDLTTLAGESFLMKTAMGALSMGTQAAGRAWEWGKSAATTLWDKSKAFMEGKSDKFSSMFGSAGEYLGGLKDKMGGFFGKFKAPTVIIKQDLEELITSRLDTIIDLLREEFEGNKVRGDKDGDGDRDGSYEDYIRKRKEEEMARGGVVMGPDGQPLAPGETAPKQTIFEKLADLKDKARNLKDNLGNMKDKASGWMSKAGGLLKNHGGKLAAGMGGTMLGMGGAAASTATAATGAAATGTVAAGGTVAGGAAVAGGGLLATVGISLAVLAGVAAVGFGAYKYMSYLSEENQTAEAKVINKKWLDERLFGYGADSSQAEAIKALENSDIGTYALQDKGKFSERRFRDPNLVNELVSRLDLEKLTGLDKLKDTDPDKYTEYKEKLGKYAVKWAKDKFAPIYFMFQVACGLDPESSKIVRKQASDIENIEEAQYQEFSDKILKHISQSDNGHKLMDLKISAAGLKKEGFDFKPSSGESDDQSVPPVPGEGDISDTAKDKTKSVASSGLLGTSGKDALDAGGVDPEQEEPATKEQATIDNAPRPGNAPIPNTDALTKKWLDARIEAYGVDKSHTQAILDMERGRYSALLRVDRYSHQVEGLTIPLWIKSFRLDKMVGLDKLKDSDPAQYKEIYFKLHRYVTNWAVIRFASVYRLYQQHTGCEFIPSKPFRTSEQDLDPKVEPTKYARFQKGLARLPSLYSQFADFDLSIEGLKKAGFTNVIELEPEEAIATEPVDTPTEPESTQIVPEETTKDKKSSPTSSGILGASGNDAMETKDTQVEIDQDKSMLNKAQTELASMEGVDLIKGKEKLSLTSITGSKLKLYGAPMEMNDLVTEWELEYSKVLSGKIGSIPKDTLMGWFKQTDLSSFSDAISDFMSVGSNPMQEDKFSYFVSWINSRFLPVYRAFYATLQAFNINPASSGSVEGLTKKEYGKFQSTFEANGMKAYNDAVAVNDLVPFFKPTQAGYDEYMKEMERRNKKASPAQAGVASSSEPKRDQIDYRKDSGSDIAHRARATTYRPIPGSGIGEPSSSSGSPSANGQSSQMTADELANIPTAKAGEGEYILPTSSDVVTSPYGPRNVKGGSKYHEGIDLRARMGDPIMAVRDGKVAMAGGKYGTVLVKHKDGIDSRYLHLSKFAVSEGQEVKQGQVVGLAGGKGPNGVRQYTPHLHFDIIKDGKKIDPESFLKSSGLSLRRKGDPENPKMEPNSDAEAPGETGNEVPADVGVTPETQKLEETAKKEAEKAATVRQETIIETLNKNTEDSSDKTTSPDASPASPTSTQDTGVQLETPSKKPDIASLLPDVEMNAVTETVSTTGSVGPKIERSEELLELKEMNTHMSGLRDDFKQFLNAVLKANGSSEKLPEDKNTPISAELEQAILSAFAPGSVAIQNIAQAMNSSSSSGNKKSTQVSKPRAPITSPISVSKRSY